jgi:hypothetical protein
MKFEFKPSFDRSVKASRDSEKEEIKALSIQLIEMLSRDREIHKGIGLKRLRGSFWEARKGLKTRILFRWTESWLNLYWPATMMMYADF